jgi:TPR repeat protein
MDEPEQLTIKDIVESEDPDAAWSYALYLRGDDADDDGPWLQAAAEAGIVPAMFAYAEFLEEHDDPIAAERWFAAAADAGHLEALYLRALDYDARGQREDAETCYRAAAEGGHPPAMFDLSRILACQNDPWAYYWAGRCDQAGYEPWDADMRTEEG